MNKWIAAIGLTTLLLIGTACGGGSSSSESGNNGSKGGAEEVTMTLAFLGLADLGPDYVYEGWLIANGAAVAAGRFTVDAGGVPSQTTFQVLMTDADAATAYVLTIEPATNDDPAPSAVHLLGGDIAAGAGRLSTDHATALGTDFSMAGGSYILATPTSPATMGGTVDDDYFRGVWFLDPTAGPAPSLTLPALPAGWTYEGWSVVGGVPHSTGRFDVASGADSDGAGTTAGTAGAPPFPGQDFVSGMPLDLRGGATVISVEPVPDNDAGPFLLKPLVDMVVDDLGAGGAQILTNQAAANNPTGTVSLDGASVPADTMSVLSVDLTGLGDLGGDFAYEGWLVGPNGPVSTGVFHMDSTGRSSYSAFAVDAMTAGQATDFVLTIEPVPDFDPMPAATKILGGVFASGSAGLSVAHGAALGDDLSSAAGTYILAAPTTAPVGGADDDYFMGVWFLDPTGAPDPSLTLPMLPAGWRYEGWVVVGGMPYSTGRFDGSAGADSDGAGASAGMGGAPGFPGQDFISGPALDLAGGAVVVSIEPEPDNSPAPFVLKPLIDTDVEDLGAGGVQSLANQSATNNPTGTATIR